MQSHRPYEPATVSKGLLGVAMLRNTTRTPEFCLPDEAGVPRSLDEIRAGTPAVLLFFRFTECPTAQRDLMAWANVHDRIRAVGARFVAISTDSVESHRALKDRFQLPFALLADVGMRVADQYHVYRSDETDEGPQPHGEPAVFILDVDGCVAYSQIQTGPKGSANPAEMALILLYMSQHGGRS